jgi:hypothetical protein
MGHGMAANKEMICDQEQWQPHAADWHDGQIRQRSEMLSSLEM